MEKPSPAQSNSITTQTDLKIPTSSLIDLNSINEDVGQIRDLLKQLLNLLRSSEDNQENLIEENERLRTEVTELKRKLKAIKSAVVKSPNRITTDDMESQQVRHNKSVYYSPIM